MGGTLALTANTAGVAPDVISPTTMSPTRSSKALTSTESTAEANPPRVFDVGRPRYPSAGCPVPLSPLESATVAWWLLRPCSLDFPCQLRVVRLLVADPPCLLRLSGPSDGHLAWKEPVPESGACPALPLLPLYPGADIAADAVICPDPAQPQRISPVACAVATCCTIAAVAEVELRLPADDVDMASSAAFRDQAGVTVTRAKPSAFLIRSRLDHEDIARRPLRVDCEGSLGAGLLTRAVSGKVVGALVHDALVCSGGASISLASSSLAFSSSDPARCAGHGDVNIVMRDSLCVVGSAARAEHESIV